MPQPQKGADRHTYAGIRRFGGSKRQLSFGNPAAGGGKTSADGCVGHALAHLPENRWVWPILFDYFSQFSDVFGLHLYLRIQTKTKTNLAAGNHRPTPTSCSSDFIQHDPNASSSQVRRKKRWWICSITKLSFVFFFWNRLTSCLAVYPLPITDRCTTAGEWVDPVVIYLE